MKNLSILQKLILATLPIIFTSIFVSIFIYKSNSTESIESGKSKTNEMIRIVGQQELETIKMSEAMLAYVSDPKDESKFQAKKAADESYGKLAEELNQYIKDSPEVLAQNKKMAEFDESTLDKLENQFLDLVKSGSQDSKQFYKEKYLPARLQQNENFKTLKNMVFEKAHSMEVEEKRQQSRMANLTILFLWVGILICLAVVVITSTKVIRQIANVANHLKSTSNEVAGAADDIADISKKLSEATTEQAASLQETSAAIEQTSSMVVKNTENAKSAAVSTAESQENAIQGQVVVQKMIQSMEQINLSNQNIMNQINESNAKISEIVTVIQEIGTKTKVINDIVFQTKLLSFNASVEAARAGEQGKGFAVVAEEVGNLAEMSGNAAKEITTLLDGSIQKVESIVNETKQKVESLIYDGEKKVQEGTTVASECGEMLNQIVEKIQSVARMAGEISNASEEQSQGVHEITKSVSQLDHVTQQNASTSQVAAQSAEALQSQAESLNSGIQNLLQVIQGKAS